MPSTRLLGSFAAWLIMASTLAWAQEPTIGSEPPKLHGNTLDRTGIVIPDACVGKVTLLLLGFSKNGGQLTAAWRTPFLADFPPDPRLTYYTVALLERAPSLLRGMIRAGMRRSTPLAERAHVVTAMVDESAWINYMKLKDDRLPAVLLLDQTGRLSWFYIGSFDSSHYASLKTAAKAALAKP